MKKWSNFFILTTLLPQLAMAVECKWWQTEVKSHDVIRHERNGTDVKSYHRQEHCREKWPGGDIFAPNLMNDKPLDWPHKEVFKIGRMVMQRCLSKSLAKCHVGWS